MDKTRATLRLRLTLGLLAALTLSVGCSRAIPSPYVQVSEPLDPADMVWNKDADTADLFPRFVLHAQSSEDWMLLDWNGEAIYVRSGQEPSELVFQAKTNKIDKLRIEGGAEILSLRRYIKCSRLDFQRSPPKLGIHPPSQPVENPLFRSSGR